jgi:hypothetical protein
MESCSCEKSGPAAACRFQRHILRQCDCSGRVERQATSGGGGGGIVRAARVAAGALSNAGTHDLGLSKRSLPGSTQCLGLSARSLDRIGLL